MTFAEQALTGPDSTFRCSPWTRAQEVDPIGSAVRFDAAVLVEWPLPWPRDVALIPELAPLTDVAGVRVMTVVPEASTAATGQARVVHRRRTAANHLVGTDHLVERSEVARLAAAIVAAPREDTSDWPSAVGESPPEVLVCAHGRRDACCGRWGTLAQVELAARGLPVRVWRCSHTGGHRFAPTAVTFPEGRYWAYVDSDLLEGVVARTGDVAEISPHHRGTSGLDPWAQVVERAVLDRLGWAWLDAVDVRATTDVAADGSRARVALTWPGGRATGDVVVRRTVPVLACGLPPEEATKSSPEYALTSFRMG